MFLCNGFFFTFPLVCNFYVWTLTTMHPPSPKSNCFNVCLMLLVIKIFFLTAGTRLLRGYKYEAVMDDKPADISHLVFVIHGIGQKMETGNIVKRSKEYVRLHSSGHLHKSLRSFECFGSTLRQYYIRFCLAEDFAHGPLGFKRWTCPEIDIIFYNILHEIWQVPIVSNWVPVLCTLLATKYIQSQRNNLLSAQSIKIGTTS